ncbi:MAG: hypothetical protein GY750_18605 [Lentisphaerae bacterium]|nr:hypothetical protein [Lentisphaerota bacterium]MCP4103410.1 hypothetical protein [Lentisphaerota bacterium]
MFSEVADTCSVLGYKVILLNHGGASDEQLIKEISDGCFFSPETIIDMDAAARTMLSDARLVISGRYHGCVNALSSGVPTIAVGHAHKYETLMHDFNFDEGYCSLEEGTLSDFFNNFIQKVDFQKAQSDILTGRQEILNRTSSMWQTVMEELAAC